MTHTETATPARYDATCGECYGNYNTAERHDCTDPAQTGYAPAPADIIGTTVRVIDADQTGTVVAAYRIYGQFRVDVQVMPHGWTFQNLRAFGEYADITR